MLRGEEGAEGLDREDVLIALRHAAIQTFGDLVALDEITELLLDDHRIRSEETGR